MHSHIHAVRYRAGGEEQTKASTTAVVKSIGSKQCALTFGDMFSESALELEAQLIWFSVDDGSIAGCNICLQCACACSKQPPSPLFLITNVKSNHQRHFPKSKTLM